MTETQDPAAAVVAEHAEAEPGVEKPAFNLLVWMSERGIFIFTTVLVIVAAVFIDGFASLANITDVFNRAAPIGIVAVGMTFVVISANYLDLSVVAQVATAAVVLIAVSNESNIPAAIGIAFVIAIVYGLVNGAAVGVFKANAVIVTSLDDVHRAGNPPLAHRRQHLLRTTRRCHPFLRDHQDRTVPLSMIVLVLITLSRCRSCSPAPTSASW